MYKDNENIIIKILDVKYETYYYNKINKTKKKAETENKLFFLIIKKCMII